MSLRFIAQYDEIDSDPALTSLRNEQNLNLDVLVTYLVNPGTALFAGYNGNGRSVDPFREHFPRRGFLGASDLTYDAWQVFVKFSYLVRF